LVERLAPGVDGVLGWTSIEAYGGDLSDQLGSYLWRSSRGKTLAEVRSYWTENVNTTQFWTGDPQQIGSPEFFREVAAFLQERRGYWYELIDDASSRYPGGQVLEVGCGAGWEAVRWARAGMAVTGIDLSDAALALATRNLEHNGLDGTLMWGNAEELPFEDDTFDVVSSLGVLHQTESTEAAVREVHRVLKPGGQAMVSIYYKHSWKILLTKFGRINFEFAHEDAPITRLYSKEEMRRLFSEFRDIRVLLGHTRATRTPRTGPLATAFNRVLLPTYNLLPGFVRDRFGHMVAVVARK
jgi:ubiquinone/menaquinone biosynthesis C-methylase UbiE